MTQEPQIKLFDETGTLRGVLYVDANDDVAIQHSDSTQELVLSNTGMSYGGSSLLTASDLPPDHDVAEGYLSTTQTGVQTGANANVFENAPILDTTTYTKNSNSQLQVDAAGRYLVQFEATFDSQQTNRKAMFAEFRLNGSGQTARTGSLAYLRNDLDGAYNSAGSSTVYDLSAGDTIEMRVGEYTSVGETVDLIRANMTVVRLE